jgi:hypothetical protein
MNGGTEVHSGGRAGEVQDLTIDAHDEHVDEALHFVHVEGTMRADFAENRVAFLKLQRDLLDLGGRGVGIELSRETRQLGESAGAALHIELSSTLDGRGLSSGEKAMVQFPLSLAASEPGCASGGLFAILISAPTATFAVAPLRRSSSVTLIFEISVVSRFPLAWCFTVRTVALLSANFLRSIFGASLLPLSSFFDGASFCEARMGSRLLEPSAAVTICTTGATMATSSTLMLPRIILKRL